MADITEPQDWLSEGTWRGQWQGAAHGAPLAVIFSSLPGPGGGPRLHRHPYSETFIIREGTGLFTIGGQTLTGRPGQIIVVPPGVRHKFTNPGPGRFESINIHASGTFDTEYLE